MPKKKIVVFISSTYEDLKPYREAVQQVILSLGMHPEGMENWAVKDATSVERVRSQLKNADIYVGIYAHRYGWQPDGYGGKSITELEYDWAGEKGIPRLCFLIGEDHLETDVIKKADSQAELEAFKTRVKEKYVGFFRSAEDLRTNVAIALAEAKENLPKEDAFQCNRVPKPPLFAGRVKELDELKKMLDGEQAVAITALRGVGGIGKTTLAQQVAYELGDQFGMKLWASLAQNFDESSLRSVLQTWANQQYPSDMKIEDMIAATRYALTTAMGDCGDNALAVIDNVWPESVGSARKLRQALPDGVRVLITTRNEAVAARLDIASTKTYRLQHMPPNEGADLMLLHLEGTSAADHRAKLEELSVVLGGHPLALTLAARMIRLNFTQRDLDDLIAEMREGMMAGEAFKNTQLDQGDEKEDSVSVTLERTLKRLGWDPFERTVNAELNALRQRQFRALGTLAPDVPFSDGYVAAVWEIEDRKGLREMVAEGLMENLALTPNPSPSGRGEQMQTEWYNQHRLLRAYARGLAREQGELDGVFGRYADKVIAVAEQFNSLPPENWSVLEGDLPHVTVVGDELVERWKAVPEDSKLQKQALGFGLNTHHYLSLRREVQRLGWLEMALESSKMLQEQKHEGLFLSEIAAYYDATGEKRKALNSLEQALSLYRLIGDRSGEATVINNIGGVWDDLNEVGKALDYFGQALIMVRTLGNHTDEVAILNNIGAVWSDLGEKRKALNYFEQALSLYRLTGNQYGEGMVLNNLGMVWSDLGEKRKALNYFEQALSLYRLIDNQSGEGMVLNNLGLVWSDLGEKRKALDSYEQALHLRRVVGDRSGEAVTLNNIGVVRLSLGEAQHALNLFEQALHLRRMVGDRSGEATTLSNMASIHFDNGEIEKSIQIFKETITVYKLIGNADREAGIHYNLAIVFAQLSRLDEAIDYIRQCISTLKRHGLIQSANGSTLVECEAFLHELEAQKSIEGVLQLSPEEVINMLVNLYREEGVDAVRTFLKQSDLDKSEIEVFLAQITQSARE
jgi:tetratricopeptide (TPR) repeat protein